MTITTYDAADEAFKVTVGVGTPAQRDAVTRTYGGDGELLSEVDGGGRRTGYTYDGFGRVTEIHHPDPANVGSSSTSDYEAFVYDDNGNVTKDRRRDGQEINLSYDALNRLTLSSLNGSQFGYDNLGRLVSTSDNTGQALGFGYDALGRVTSQSGPLGTVTSQYDLNGNRTRLTWPDGIYVTYDRDVLGQVRLVGQGGGGALLSYAYDDLGRRTAFGRANGMGTNWWYGADLRLSAMYHAFPNASFNVLSYLEFDPAGQLHAVNVDNAVFDWFANGASFERTYQADGQNKYTVSQALGQSATSFSYDGRGNLANDGMGAAYAYDAANRLTWASNGATAAYDPAGRLWQTTGYGNTTRFLYDGSQIIGEVDGSGTVLRRYVPGAGGELGVWYEGAGTSDPRFYAQDWAGSVLAVADAQGVFQAWNTYDEAGVKGPNNAGRFQWRGQPFIPELGLYHMGARTYSPTLGRFLQPDPIGTAGGLNLYAYAGNDPVNFFDPTGFGENAVNCPPNSPNCATPVTEVVVTAKKYSDSAAVSGAPQFVSSSDTGPLVFGRPTLTEFIPSGAQPQRGQSLAKPTMGEDEREREAEKDEEVCRGLSSPAQRARCWASANDRRGARAAGRPLPPLVTWRNAGPGLPSPRNGDLVKGGAVLLTGGALACLIVEPCGGAVAAGLGLGALLGATAQ